MDRDLLDDGNRTILEVDADSGVPRGAGGGPIVREEGLTVAEAARTPLLELSDFLIGVSALLDFVIPMAVPGRGRGALGVVNNRDWRREPRSGRPTRVGAGVEPPVPFTPNLRLS